ncbi:MFS transporter [Halosegnis sp.]|uniref:MFS transporter n=1 Tax=Halosegnis sp. TaxID=2864959 RepID=UPI0035D4BFFE
MATETDLARLRGGGRGWTLLAIALGWVFILGGRFLVPAVLPQVKATFGITDFAAGVAVTLLWGGYAVMQSPAGLLIDRVGERRLLAGSLAATAAGVGLLGIAPAFFAFLAGCAAFGVATGFYGPARGTTLSRTFPDNDRSAIGATLAAGSVGSAALPFLAGALVGDVGWRLVVGGLALPLGLASLLTWWAVPARERRTAADRPSARRLLADALLAMRLRPVALTSVAMTLMLFVFQGLTAFYVTFLVTERGFTQPTAAALFALLFVGAAVAQIGGGAAADRIGERPVLVVTALAGVPLVAVVPLVDGPLVGGVVSLLLGTRLAVAPVTNAYIIDTLPDDVTGTAWGTLRTGFFLLAATGSTVVGAMADAGLFAEAFYLLAVVTAVAVGLYLLLPAAD